MQIRSFLYKNATRARLSFAIRRRIGAKPLLNAGVFCLHRKATIWPVLRRWQEMILPRRNTAFTQDQLCMALAVYIDGLPVTFLDNSHNYLGPWLLDETTGQLANLFFPHPPVGIVHMASQKAMRAALENTMPVPTVQGGQATVNLRYGAMRLRRAAATAPDGAVTFPARAACTFSAAAVSCWARLRASSGGSTVTTRLSPLGMCSGAVA